MTTTEHLSLAQVRAYVSGALHPSTLVTIDDHLESCAACRAALARESDASFGAEAFGRALARPEARPESPHLAFEHLRGAVDGTLGGADAEWVEAHTALCVMCAEELRDLERFAAFVPIKIAIPLALPEPMALAAPTEASLEPVLRRARQTVAPEADIEPPPAYGATPPARLPVWVWAAAGGALLLVGQMWAC
jgi:anti-sigma factor RsiW